MIPLSICIPTYNRAGHLTNCLESIRVSRAASRGEIEVCVSDNCSTDGTEAVVRRAQQQMSIKYSRNNCNLGIPRNFLRVIEMATGQFAWLLGDDDLVMPNGIDEVCRLIEEHRSVDFFFVNSFHLTTEYVLSFPQPFSTADLPRDMKPFSSWPTDGELNFMDLIAPARSFDFLGGMFLSVFRRSRWVANAGALRPSALEDSRIFSEFDNTFPHVKIFSRAFAKSKAYFHARPLSVCLTGAREWAPMYPMVCSVRLVEALNEYRRNGLPLRRYLRCRNYALRNFVPDLAYMLLNRSTSGWPYLRPFRLLLANSVYPNSYLSVIYYVFRKTKKGATALGRFAWRTLQPQWS